MRLSHFHAREICVWTGLIQANTRRHSSVCSYHGGCILVRSARLCVFSVELMWRKISDKQPVFSSQCQPSLSLHHTGPLYHTTDTMITSLSPLSSLSLSLIRSCSVFNIQTYHKTSESRRVCLIRQFYKYWQIEAKTAVWQNLIQSYIFLIRTSVDFWFSYVDLCPGVYGIQVFIG